MIADDFLNYSMGEEVADNVSVDTISDCYHGFSIYVLNRL